MSEQIDHPTHYNVGAVEAADGMDAILAGWMFGRSGDWSRYSSHQVATAASACVQAAKYIWRAPLKPPGPVVHLEKALWWILRAIRALDPDWKPQPWVTGDR